MTSLNIPIAEDGNNAVGGALSGRPQIDWWNAEEVIKSQYPVPNLFQVGVPDAWEADDTVDLSVGRVAGD